MNRDQRMGEIRRRVARYRSMTIDAKMAQPAFAFGCMSDEAFLLAELDEAARQLAHFQRAPTAAMPSMHEDAIPTPADIERPFVVPTAPTIAAPGDWNEAIDAAAARVETSISRSITLRLPLDSLRANAVYDVRGLRRA